MAKKSPSTPKAARKDPAAAKAAFEALVSEKISAGLSRSDAEFCARQQLVHDAALAGESPDDESGGEGGESGSGEGQSPAS